ncbi:hypothetical protein EOE48_01100 [Methylobacterium oryzihabitans]|uniref:OmpW family protein n=2 Tax=Methylobacterium oryzihabitans TaxID=2499852 RepID=A0A437PI73_9HYPH|nr:hypothetical protein EOE48_01100 [Methylobacterium oryzihabitans]
MTRDRRSLFHAASRIAWALAAALWVVGPASPGRAAEPGPDAAPSGGLTAGSLLIRGRLIGSIPVGQHSRIEPIGGRIITPTRALPDADATYFLTDRIAIAGQGGILPTRTSIRGSRVGDLPVGTTWSASLNGAVQVHVLPHAAFNPYLGAGVGYTAPIAYQPAKPLVTPMKADPQVGPMLQAGFDYHLGGRWYANMEIKRFFLPTLVSRIGPGSATVALDMVIVGAGLGYRF